MTREILLLIIVLAVLIFLINIVGIPIDMLREYLGICR